MYITNFDEFCEAAEKLYASNPANVSLNLGQTDLHPPSPENNAKIFNIPQFNEIDEY